MAMAAIPLVMGAVSAAGQMKQGQANAGIATADAAAEAQNQQQIAAQTAMQEQQQRYISRRVMASATAQQGASGLDSSGSFADVQAENARQAELQALSIRYGGQSAIARSQNQARLDQYKAGNTTTAANIGAGTSLLQGAYQYKMSGT